MSTKIHNPSTSFEELFNDNYARLCHFAMQYLEDHAATKDVVQEVFINYWNMKEKPNPEVTTVFLYSAVKNACFNKLRRQKLEHGYLNKQDIDPSEEAIALNSMIRSEVLSELHKIITTLPDNCQRIFRMGYLEGLKNPQIAEELGISVNTVKTQKQRALKIIKSRVNPDLFAIICLIILK